MRSAPFIGPILVLAQAASAASWSSARLLSDPAEAGWDVKEPAICPAAAGGFHAMYRSFTPNGVRLQYRRYSDGTLSPVKTLHVGTLFGGDICEAGNGDIHIVWENWDDTPDIGWTRSTNGGLTFSAPTEITNFGNVGKWPYIAHFGTAHSGQVVMSCGKADGKRIWFNSFSGRSWSGFGGPTAVNYESEYEIHGIARSPVDGSIYRLSDDSANHLVFQRYGGSTWVPTQVLEPGFYPRCSIAVNAAGQVMVTWEQDNAFYSRLYTPRAGFGSIRQIQGPQHPDGHAGYGTVTAIPGSNTFYAVYTKDVNRVRAKPWSSRGWGAEEVVSVGQPAEFTVNTQVAAGPDGTLYACWEYWGTGKPQAWFSVKQAPRPGDYDEDGDVDLTDFARFRQCFRGTGSAATEVCRRAFDADSDGDVDVQDLGRFVLYYTGPTGG